MPQLGENPANDPVKLLLLGHSSVGKTGAIATLAAAGYRVFIYDFDNGVQILLDETILPREFRKNIFVKTFTDKIKDAKGNVDGMPTAFTGFIDNLNDWKELVTPGVPAVADATGKITQAAVPPVYKSLGNPGTWGAKDVIVIDSLTFLGNAAMRYVLFMNNRGGQPPQLQHWGEAIRMQEDVIARLYSEQVHCNVVVCAHLLPVSDQTEGGVMKFWPSALGNKLAPKISRYFNNVWLIQKQVLNNVVKREMKTSATFNIDLKSSKPGKMAATMEPDLAKAFAIIQEL